MHKTKRLSSFARARSGFSLVEMIGVLAIIAILAVIIVPKVFSTIASSRVTSAAGSVTSLKSAVTEFAGKYGTIPLTTTVVGARLDDLLYTAGMLEGRFVVKIGTPAPIPPVVGASWAQNAAGVWTPTAGATQNAQSRIICITGVPAAVPSAGAGNNYYLDGNALAPIPAGSRIVSAAIMGCTGAEARELSAKIDGDSMTQALATTADTAGKVVYAAPNAQGITNVYIYLAHQ